MNLTQLFFAIAPLTLALIGLLVTWMRWRKNELRRDEVLQWADECIDSLQSLFLISYLEDSVLSSEKRDEIRLQTIFKTSILIERGRLFFKNEVSDNHGAEKLPAYRGYRPRILDHLVAAHQIARFWPDADLDEAKRRTIVADTCLKSFVSLAQKEVGRDRAASIEAIKGGDGINLASIMREVELPKAK